MIDILSISKKYQYISPYLGQCIKCLQPLFEDSDDAYQYALNKSVKLATGAQYVCQKCFNSFATCMFCRGPIENRFLFMGACPSCVHLSPKHAIKNYSFKVDSEIPMIGESKDQVFYGVELELESKNYGFDTLIVSEMVKSFARLKKDSSLEQGFEIVTAPASLQAHYELWSKFFSKLPETVYPLRTCGMHVHASRVRLSDLQIGKILCFLHNPENYSFVKLIAGRRSSYHNNYTSFKKLSDGLNGGMLPQNAERHTALNLNCDKTIEFRIFRSTKNPDELFKNLEFCKSIIKFTDWGVSSITEAKSWRKFVEFVYSQNRNEYPSLRKFLKSNLKKV